MIHYEIFNHIDQKLKEKLKLEFFFCNAARRAFRGSRHLAKERKPMIGSQNTPAEMGTTSQLCIFKTH